MLWSLGCSKLMQNFVKCTLYALIPIMLKKKNSYNYSIFKNFLSPLLCYLGTKAGDLVQKQAWQQPVVRFVSSLHVNLKFRVAVDGMAQRLLQLPQALQMFSLWEICKFHESLITLTDIFPTESRIAIVVMFSGYMYVLLHSKVNNYENVQIRLIWMLQSNKEC